MENKMGKKIFAVLIVSALAAALSFGQQTSTGMSLNGVTGLIATPTAHIGWEENADIGVDAGYHWVHGDRDTWGMRDDTYNTHIPKLAVSLFKKAEIAVAYDTMDHLKNPDTDPYSVLVNGKFQFYKEGVSAVAAGGNLQFINDILESRGKENYTAGQIYLVATYSGEFFNMPAATSLSFGKTFADEDLDVETDDVDFSMGFELTLFPELLKGYVHWINDFSNYSYSAGSTPAGSVTSHRGSYNTGVRVDPLKRQDFKLVIDAILADVLDGDDRSFILGLTFGMAVK
jgi:hypothetical protein